MGAGPGWRAEAALDLRYSISHLQRESLIFQDRFSIDCDLDDVADGDAASVHGAVPTDVKVLAID